MSGFIDAMSDPDINPLAGIGQSIGDSAYDTKEWILKSTEYVEQHLKQIMHEVWQSVVGAGAATLDWLEALVLGEFSPVPKPLSVIITEAFAMFTIPNTLLVVGARDAAAVGWRLYSKPEARDEWTEWLVFFANIMAMTVPIVATAVGALAAGVGAIGGNVIADKVGVFLRTTMLTLISRATVAEEVAVRYFNKINLIVKGKITPLLEKIDFTVFTEPMKKIITAFTNQVIKICKALRVAIPKIKIFGREVGEHIEAIMRIHRRLQEIEDAYFAIQYRAVDQVAKAMTEFNKELKAMLEKVKNKPTHEVTPGQSAHPPEPVIKPGAPIVERQSPGAQEIDDHSKKYHQERHDEPQGTHHEVPGSPGPDTEKKPASTGVATADAAHAHPLPKPLTDGEHPNTKVEGGGEGDDKIVKALDDKARVAESDAATNSDVAIEDSAGKLTLPGMNRSVRAPNINFPPNQNVVDAMNSPTIQNMASNLDYVDCSEIAEKLQNAAGGSGNIIEVTPSQTGTLNVYGNGEMETGQYYHQVYMDSQYVYDPRLSTQPIPSGDWLQHINNINPDGINISDTPKGLQ